MKRAVFVGAVAAIAAVALYWHEALAQGCGISLNVRLASPVTSSSDFTATLSGAAAPQILISGRTVLDACGDPLLIRGVEQSTWDPLAGAFSRIASEIAATGANAVRLIVTLHNTSPAELDVAIGQAIANGLVVYVSPSKESGEDGLDPGWNHGTSVLPYWTTGLFTGWNWPEMHAVIDKYGPGMVILDALAETDTGDSEAGRDTWAARATTALANIRAAGYPHTVVLMGNMYGRDPVRTVQNTGAAAAAIAATDTFSPSRVIFGWQSYWAVAPNADYYGSTYGPELGYPSTFRAHEVVPILATLPVPVQIGLDYQDDIGITDYILTKAGAATHSVGWLYWSWEGTDSRNDIWDGAAINPRYSDIVGAPSGLASATKARPYWTLPTVDRVRFFPRAGFESAMTGGQIQGSNDSPTNGFVTLYTISSQPSAGWNDVSFGNATPYRWVKYVGPGENTGTIAELELYDGTTLVPGLAFGTTGTSGHEYGMALDGSTTTYYEGTGTVSNYVGRDIADGYVVATPQITPAGGTVPQTVSISTATTGATIRYTTDGSNPTSTTGTVYSGSFQVTVASTVKAIAYRSCMQTSAVATETFTSGGASSASVLVVGNSLTDTVDSGFLTSIAAAAGVSLGYYRYTIPGIGTHIYDDNPTGGNWTNGSGNVQTFVQTTPLNNITFQPAANMPCIPQNHQTESPAANRSDGTNMISAWDDQVPVNANVVMWVYSTWKAAASSTWADCMTGSWNRDTEFGSHDHNIIWNPSAPGTWEAAVDLHEDYNEAVRSYLIDMYPGRVTPWIIPGGRALRGLRTSIEAGTFPGVATNGFEAFAYNIGGTDDHLSNAGRYLISLVFYSLIFQQDPRNLADTDLGTLATGLTSAQYAALQSIAYDTVSGYALSGWTR